MMRVSNAHRWAFHVPAGGEWFSLQAPALAAADSVAASGAAAEGREGVVMVWDRPPGTKLYGAYPDHAAMWAAACEVAPEHRCGYELIREGRACKFYADVELYVPLSVPAAAVDAALLLPLLGAVRRCVSVGCADGALGSEGAAPSSGVRLTVLDGTRTSTLTPAKALAYGVGASGAEGDGASGAEEGADSEPVRVRKISYHIIAQGPVFAGADVVRRFAERLPTLETLVAPYATHGGGVPTRGVLAPLLQRQPHALDLSVYSRNRSFRMLGCCKLGAPVGGGENLRFHATLNECDDPMAALITLVPPPEAAARIPLPPPPPPSAATTKPTKKKRAREDDDAPRHTDRPALDGEVHASMRPALQAMLGLHGDHVTEVRGLIAVEDGGARGAHLRWECRNRGSRPCLLAQMMHENNQALLWLVPAPSAPEGVAGAVGGAGGDNKKTYLVKYRCMSQRCGRAAGVLGELRPSPDGGEYQPHPTLPAELLPCAVRPPGFKRRLLASAAPPAAPLAAALAPRVARQVSPVPRGSPSPSPEPRWGSPSPSLSEPSRSQSEPSPSRGDPGEPAEPSPRRGESQPRRDSLREPSPSLSEPSQSDCPGEPSRSQSEPAEPRRGESPDDAPPPPPPPDAPQAAQAAPAVEDPEENTYELVKARFEIRCFKVLSPFAYANIIPGSREPDLYTPTVLKQLYANLYYYERDGQTLAWRKRLFINRWMGDVDIRHVTRIVVDPTLPPAQGAPGAQQDVYNLWSGFAAERLPPVPQSDVQALVAPFVRHMHDVYANGSAQLTEFLLDYFCNLVQRPHQPTGVALSLYGRQGCGKGMPITFLRERVLGTDCAFQTANPENDLLGRFQNGCLNRILIQVDEVKNLRNHDDKLKNLITNDTIQFERKGRDIITVRNLVNLIFTSNNENALAIATDDRRFVLMRCSDRYRGDTEYLSALGQHLDRPEVARAFYQFAMARDLSAYPFNFQPRRPITAYYEECRAVSIPVHSRFLSALLNSGVCPERIGALALFTKYASFVSTGNYKASLTETAFGRNIRRITGITKGHTMHGTVYTLEPDAIRRWLVEAREYDEDTSLA